jgi:lipopolysaccharide/colanic/teichoic acid biosynthesis glycosyltransferase
VANPPSVVRGSLSDMAIKGGTMSFQEGEYARVLFAVQTQQSPWLYLTCKRVLDVVVSGIAFVLLLPIMLLIGVLVRLDSPGPAVFRQKRVGFSRRVDGQQEVWVANVFTICKFRTMNTDADPEIHRTFVKALIRNDEKTMIALQGEDTQVRKLVHDPRVTRVGRFLRKTSLDELPQLWNVLKGDMSLVGPRPPIPYEVDEYQPWHCRRLEVKPGLTGLWQISARSSAGFDEMVRLDIQYVEQRSFWLDLKILLRTPLAVLSGRGAV